MRRGGEGVVRMRTLLSSPPLFTERLVYNAHRAQCSALLVMSYREARVANVVIEPVYIVIDLNIDVHAKYIRL